MDDLAGKISQILNDPASMEKLKSLSGMLGLSDPVQPSQEPPKPPQAQNSDPLGALLGGLTGGGNPTNILGALAGPGGSQGSNPEMLQSLLKITPLLSRVQQEDNSTRLLYALRPFLKPERQKRLDQSANMMRMFKLLPLLKGSGIF